MPPEREGNTMTEKQTEALIYILKELEIFNFDKQHNNTYELKEYVVVDCEEYLSVYASIKNKHYPLAIKERVNLFVKKDGTIQYPTREGLHVPLNKVITYPVNSAYIKPYKYNLLVVQNEQRHFLNKSIQREKDHEMDYEM